MKLAAIVLGTAVVSTSAVTSLSVQADEYEYRGARTAAAVCQAVVEDRPADIDRLVRRAARHDRLTSFTSHSRKSALESFQCNELNLSDFAQEVDARKATAYLEGSEENVNVAQN